MILLFASAALAGTLAPGVPLDNAAALHVSQGGLDHLGEALSGVVPSSFSESSISGEFECDSGDAKPLGYAINGLNVGINVENVGLTASEGRLDLDLDLSLTATADEVLITGDCTFLFKDLDQSCGMEISAADAVELGLHIGLQMELQDDGSVDVTVDDVSYEIGAIPNPLNDCAFATIVDALLGLNPDFLTDLIVSFIDPALDGIDTQIEDALEGALSGLSIETTVPLLSVDLDLSLAPSELTLSEDGMLLGFSAAVAVSDISECVDAGEGSTVNSSGWPAVGNTAWDEGALPYDAALLVNKDLLDHLLWNVWASGILCSSVSDLVDLPLDTDFLGNVYGDSFKALFPTAQPVELALEAVNQPTARFDDDIPIYIDLNTLGINTASTLDARLTRVCQVGVDGSIAVDPGITSEAITPELIIDPGAWTYSEPYNELLEPGYSSGLSTVLNSLISTLLPDDLLPTIALPTWQGIGLKEVVWQPSDDGQWQGGFIMLNTDDVEPLELSGCSGCDGGTGDLFGCEDTGCSGDGGCDSACSGGSTCSTGPKRNVASGRALLAIFLATLIGRRRRA